MKKIIAILAFVVAVLSLSAQNKLLYYSGGNVIYTKTIENIDSVSFLSTGTSTAYTNISSETPFSFPVMGIDSIVLYIASLDGEEPQQQDDGDWIYINYTNGGAVGVVNPWSSRGITVTCNGEDVVVNALSGTEDRTIVVTGTTADGSLTISSDNKFDLRLNGASITNPTGAAINVLSDVRVKLILEDGTTSSLADGSTSEFKAAFLCEGSIEVYGNGTLNVAGNKQHGINSDAHINVYTGTINVTSAVKDGIHANNFRLYGGNVTVSGFGGDGIEAEYGSVEHADQGTIKLMGGSLNMTVANADCKGLKCDTLTIQGGTHNLTASGAQTKAIKSTMVYVAGGNTTITASGAAVVTAGDPSYCTGIKATEMYVTNGELTITCPSSNDGARAISTDNLFSMNGGTITLSVAGNGGSYTNTSNVADTYSATCIKSDVSVDIYGGTLDLTCSGTDSKGISCDNVVNLNEGTFTFRATGSDSKAVKADQTLNINDGTFTVTCSGVDSKGFSSDGILDVEDGNITMTLSGNASKGFKADQNMLVAGGSINVTASGSTVVTNSDPSYCIAIKGNTTNINGGEITVNCTSTNTGGRAISADGVLTINGGTMNFTTAGSGTTITTSDGYSPVCIKADGDAYIYGGTIICSSSGKGGRGIKVDGALVIGQSGAADNLLNIEITTSGTAVNSSSDGGWGGSSSSSYSGNPKGIKCLGNLTINSGRVAVYSNQEGIESKTAIYVNGGIIEVNSKDDGLNAGVKSPASGYLEINGGKLWIYARGSDALDCNGARTVINGGLIIAGGSGHEQAVDCNLGETQGNTLEINGGTLLAFGGTMGAWSQSMGGGGFPGGGSSSSSAAPTMTNQKYLLNSSSSGGGYPGGGSSSSSTSITSTIVIKDASNNTILIYKGPTVSGNGWETNYGTGTKPPGGGNEFGFSSPDVQSGNYSIYTTATISGGESWHGFYTGATATTSGTATSVTAKP
ncbi:MAG: carbohydrate-binding domain-containing protein [Bacteroidales bacterium]|nr:carbohydrate-binding domain-containing protein [Bacteroidales bacterium]